MISYLTWLYSLSVKTFNTVFIYQRYCKFGILVSCISIFTGNSVYSQEIISLSSVIDSSLSNNPSIKEATAIIKQQQQLIKTAVNLPAPEILIQNPTGNFYTVGVQQAFDFPTVYSTQKKVQKEKVKFSEITKQLTLSDMKYKVSILYNELKYEYQLTNFLEQQDSIFKIIAENADRSFKAGTIDFVQTSFAKLQASQLRSDLYLAQANYKGILQNLKIISGMSEDFIPDTIFQWDNDKANIQLDTSLRQNYSFLLAEQQVAIDKKRLSLEKQKALPGFSIGYINSGEKNTPYQNRFFAGVKVPIWFWQFKGSIDAAKSQIQVSQYNSEANNLQLSAEIQTAYLKYIASKKALEFYKSDIVQQSTFLVDASNRFFTSGNTSYTDYLRNLIDVKDIQKKYLELTKEYNQAIIYIKYLTGNQ